MKQDKIVGACSTDGREENAYNIVVGKPGGERQLGRPRHRWEDNIRMDLREIACEGVHGIHLA
jgi:hypothetical protein